MAGGCCVWMFSRTMLAPTGLREDGGGRTSQALRASSPWEGEPIESLPLMREVAKIVDF